MENFTTMVEDMPNGNFRIRYRNGKTREKNGSLKKFLYKTVDKDETLVIGEKALRGKKLAHALADKLKERHLKGELNVVECDEPLDTIIEGYIQSKQDSGVMYGTWKHYEHSLKLLLETIPRLEDLTHKKIILWKAHLKAEGYSPKTIYGAVGDLRIFCKWLVIEKKLGRSPFIDEHGFSRKLAGAAPASEPKFWLIEEFVKFDRIAGELNKHFQVANRLAYLYGMRRVEIAGNDKEHWYGGVQWTDLIRTSTGRFILDIKAKYTKGMKHGRQIPINPVYLGEIRKEGLIVPLKVQQIVYFFKEARKQAAFIDKRTFHGERHSFSKDFTELAGQSDRVLQAMLGHRDGKTTQIYNAFRPQHLGPVMDKFEAARQQIMTKVVGQNREILGQNLTKDDIACKQLNRATNGNHASNGHKFANSPTENGSTAVDGKND